MKKINILIIEELHPLLISYLQLSNQYQLLYLKESISSIELNKIISQYSILIIRGTQLKDPEFFNQAHSLKLIIRAGKGIDNIDLTMAKNHGIEIFNIENANTVSAAEFTIGLILCLLHHIVKSHLSLLNNQWLRLRKRRYGNNLRKRKIGFVGFGRIPKAIFKRLKNFHTKCFFFDPYISDYPNIKKLSLKELFAFSDIISIHLPLTKETYHMIDNQYLSLMKKNSFIINTSRGDVIKEQDLLIHLKEKKIQGAAIDVFSEEPLKKDHPFKKLKNVILTPHIAGVSRESEYILAKSIKKKLISFYDEYKNISCSN